VESEAIAPGQAWDACSLGSVSGEAVLARVTPKRARRWKRRIQPRDILQSVPSLLYSEPTGHSRETRSIHRAREYVYRTMGATAPTNGMKTSVFSVASALTTQA